MLRVNIDVGAQARSIGKFISSKWEAVMTTVQGSYNSNLPYLQNFTQTVILSFNSDLTGGSGVLVQGRLWIHNKDSGDQKFQLWLTVGYPPQTIDYIELNLGARHDEWVTLYGWVLHPLPVGTPIEIRAATYNGEAGLASRVVATVVDGFKLTPDSHVERTDKVVEPAE
jgi:hypothetical protein